MPIVRCPHCSSEAEVDHVDLGHQVACPTCSRPYEAREIGKPAIVERSRADESRPRRREFEDYEERGYGSRRRSRDAVDREELEDDVQRAKNKVFVPALVTSIFCILWLGWQTLDAVAVILMPQVLQNNPLLPKNGPFEITQSNYLACKAVLILWQLVTLAGAFAMMRLGSLGFAKAAMMMSLVPCFSLCLVFGVPVGIWGLMVLSSDDVVRGYRAKAILEGVRSLP